MTDSPEPQVGTILQDSPSAEQLYEAAVAEAASTDGSQLQDLVGRYYTDIDIKNQDGLTALHLALQSHNDKALEALVDCGAYIEAFDPWRRRPLFIAIQDGRIETVEFLLRRGALTDEWVSGHTPLHEAAALGDTEIVHLLLDFGADVNAASLRERQPLFSAVENWRAPVVRELLSRGADPDTFSADEPPTALHLACDNGDIESMHALLDGGAKVDLRDFHGATPLFRAVAAGHREASELLLRHGASIRVWRSDGLSVLDLAEGDDEMLELLQADRIWQGPRIRGSGQPGEGEAGQSSTLLKPPPLPAENDRDKMVACQGFRAVITDFFIGDEGEHEQFIPMTASVYELLYSHGPGAIRNRSGDREPSFTWYHLPANNMTWVEGLVRRLAAERGDVSAEMYEEFKNEMELTGNHTGNGPAASSSANLSTMKPLCRSVPMPFLHFEEFGGHQTYAKALEKPRPRRNRTGTFPPQPPPEPSKVSDQGSPVRPASPARRGQSGSGAAPAVSVRSGNPTERAENKSQASTTWAARLGQIVSSGVSRSLGNAPDARNINVEADVERQASRSRNGNGPSSDHSLRDREGSAGTRSSQNSRRDAPLSARTPSGSPANSIPGPNSTRSTQPGNNTGNTQSISLHSTNSTAPRSIRLPSSNSERGSNQGLDGQGNGPSLGSQARSGRRSERQSQQQRRRNDNPVVDPPTENLNEYLIRGYFHSDSCGLQPRRTLDQYVYAGMETASNRDDDQVVYRYTRDGTFGEAKIFMVDQLWMWILGKDTIVTCCPLRWDPWLGKKTKQPTLQPTQRTKPGFYVKWFSGFVQATQHVPVRQWYWNPNTMPPGIWGPEGGRAAKRQRDGRQIVRQRGAPGTEKGFWPEVDPYDPLNISQRINQYLLKPGRGAIESVHELAGVITTSCIDAFDPYQVDEEYLFLDFFERSIGRVNDKVVGHMREFKQSVSEFRDGAETLEVMDITNETELMIEVDDILDELHTLKLILTDQKSVVEDMNGTLKDVAGNARATTYVQTKTLDNHLMRIDHMEGAARKADKSLHRLVDLKQKQGSLTEAYYARESARDTARQGKTVVVFTVVTIIFLPVSFLAAIFAIETNGFPRDDDDKIPFDYLLQYILTIGLALSIPLIIIAFNVETIAQWLNALRKWLGHLWKLIVMVSIGAGLLLAILAPVWTSSLSAGIKAAVSVVVLLLSAVAIIGYGIHRLVGMAQQDLSVSSKSEASS